MTHPTKKLGEIFNRLTGTVLSVPYISQINENACGATVLEMVYKYYGLNDVSQADLYEKYRVLEPYNTGNFRLNTDSLVADALSRGFLSLWARADYKSKKAVIQLLEQLTQKAKLPIIVCQKFTDDPRHITLGHFRIVVGIKNELVYVHDPHSEHGGAFQEWNLDKFIDFWKPTGQNVTGGVFVVIKKF